MSGTRRRGRRLIWLLVALGALAVGCSEAPATAPPTAALAPTPAPAATATAQPAAEASALESPGFSKSGWKTDFSKHSVPLSELRSGGPPRDGIPPIDSPKFVGPADAGWLKDSEPVVVYEEGGDARAYPLQILIWHEIVNDSVNDRPVLITFCPLCNTAIAFDRRLDGATYDFGTSGNLRKSDLVMWDRQTESWWQQIGGEAIVGQLSGARLTPLPASINSFADFKAAFPNGRVLSRETGHVRDYGRNPYSGYDDVNSSPFLFTGKADGRLRPMERVVTVSLNGEDVAYPFAQLEQRRLAQDRVGGTPIVVLYRKGTVSALDASTIAGSRDIGSTGVFEPRLAPTGDTPMVQRLSFRADGDRLVDAETGSEWNTLGQATAGPLVGRRLVPVVHGNHFWFATAAFLPNVRIWNP